MAVKKHFAILLVAILFDSVLAQSDISGFINIDCGLPPEKGSHVETETGLRYVSDASFIAGGVSRKTPPEYNNLVYQHLAYIRSFPHGKRNCYTVPVTRGKKYLIKAVFAYLNYDGRNLMPVFDLYLGNARWSTVAISGVDVVVTKEIIHTPLRSNIFVCLVNNGSGTPFISALETRAIDSGMYTNKTDISLALLYRCNLGPSSMFYRYPDDKYDRTWGPLYLPNWRNISTVGTVETAMVGSYNPPVQVMRTAASPINASKPLNLGLTGDYNYFVFLHFAEIEILQSNQSRVFDIFFNGDRVYSYYSPQNFSADVLYSVHPTINSSFKVTISASENSTLPPLLNALEVYTSITVALPTDEGDADVLQNIKSMYNISMDWEGDPCGPEGYPWNRVSCSYSNSTTPVVVSLDLSSGQLRGQIPQHLSNLTHLQVLDLSNNNFSGPVPEFLTQLSFLKVLNLGGNNLTGTIPNGLADRSNAGSLSINVTGNPGICLGNICNKKEKKKNGMIIVILVVVAAVIALPVAAVIVFLCWKKRDRRPKPVEAGARVALVSNTVNLPYSSIVTITNNFDRMIGEGASARVYSGVLNENPVAVKIMHAPSAGGTQLFQTEANHLLTVHHNNLTRLVGYCNEGNHLALVYEFMANGSLQKILSGSPEVLSWNQRIKIAMDFAQGLEYLHNHCTIPIIHRDIKPGNILLDAEFRAKISDFGISRCSPTEQGTGQLSATIAGTPGYLDPECFQTGRLTTKSDVYSFGVVLLELVLGLKPVGSHSGVRQWADSQIRNGDIESIIDPSLNGDFDVNNAWIIVELGIDCTSPSSAMRPSMSQVLSRLQGCMRNDDIRRTGTINLSSRMLSPQAR